MDCCPYTKLRESSQPWFKWKRIRICRKRSSSNSVKEKESYFWLLRHWATESGLGRSKIQSFRQLPRERERRRRRGCWPRWCSVARLCLLTTPRTAARARQHFNISALPEGAFDEINRIQTRQRFEDDAICDFPKSGERIVVRGNLQALRSHHPGKPSSFNVKRILGDGDLWIRKTHSPYFELRFGMRSA